MPCEESMMNTVLPSKLLAGSVLELVKAGSVTAWAGPYRSNAPGGRFVPQQKGCHLKAEAPSAPARR